MLAMATSISLNEYLNTSYRPDCDYVDGEVRERCCGLSPHARMLSVLAGEFWIPTREAGLRTLLLVRTRVSPDRVRIAEVCVVRREAPMEDVIETPPLLVIEVLQEDDTMEDQTERVRDFIGMGVGSVWVIDPVGRAAFVAGAGGELVKEEEELRVAGSEICLSVRQLFAEGTKLSQ